MGLLPSEKSLFHSQIPSRSRPTKKSHTPTRLLSSSYNGQIGGSKCCRHLEVKAISWAIASSEPPTSMEISQETPMVSCPSIVPRPTPMKRSKFFFNAAACALKMQVLAGKMPPGDTCWQPSTSNWVALTQISQSRLKSAHHVKQPKTV